jgi:hypothetical protein
MKMIAAAFLAAMVPKAINAADQEVGDLGRSRPSPTTPDTLLAVKENRNDPVPQNDRC